MNWSGGSYGLRKFDFILFGAVVLLIGLGLTAIYSINLGLDTSDFTNLKKQLVFAAVGLVVFFAVSLMDYSAFRIYGRYIYWGTVILLIIVLLWGKTVRGTTGWISIFGMNLQPVELAKIALIIFLARFFSNRFQQFNQARHIFTSLVATLILFGLIVLQPDLGSGLVLLGLWFVLLLLTGVRWQFVVTLVSAGILIAVILWSFVLAPYQQDRFLSFIYPERDPLGSGYNVTQSIIAVGSGGLAGRGLGFGSQSQLKFIPESQTDFIFAVISEELGFVGDALFFSLWLIIFYRIIRIAKQARDDFGLFLCLGVLVVLMIHVFINIGFNLGVVPVTGISLPFVSYGGSFLVTALFMVGLVESVAIRR